MRYFMIFFITLFTLSSVDANELPFVSWTMDNHTESKLLPNFNEDPRWIGELVDTSKNNSSFDLFVPGVSGNAINIQNRTFQIARNLTKNDCVANPERCETGITLTFWIFLRYWKNDSSQNVISIGSGDTENVTSLVQLRIENNTLIFCILFTNDDKSHCVTSAHDVMSIKNKWTYIGLMWNATKNTSTIFVINSSLPVKLPNESISTKRILYKTSCLGKFEIGGKKGLWFYLDSLKVFYSALNDKAIMAQYVGCEYPHEHDNPVTSQSQNIYTRSILLATLIPLAVVAVFLGLCCYFFRIRRAKNSFRSYIRQTSTKIEDRRNSRAVYSDVGDEHTDLDSEGELEKLHNRLINSV